MENVVERPEIAPVGLFLVVLLLERVFEQMRILHRQRRAPALTLIDVAVVAAEVAGHAGVVHHLDHRVET
jgi:hypothetical protein